MPYNVVDLFCGVGGLTHGLVLEGFNVLAGVDTDASCKYAYEVNNAPARFLLRDVATLGADELAALYPDGEPRVLVGCAPCQPFSLYSNPTAPDERWRLLNAFGNMVQQLRPDVVSMENVPQLARHAVFREFVATLLNEGYSVSYFLVRGPEYGIPQRRVRLVLFASLYGTVALVPPTNPDGHGATVRSAISHLPPVEAGQVCAIDPLHRARGLTPLNLRRIQSTPEGGSWKDWPDDLILECHRKATGQSFKSVYGRMRWDEPSSVITTQCIGIGNGRFGHPDQDRAISLREAALLQTFPGAYCFVPPDQPVSMQSVARHVGNAVPVQLGRVVGQSINNHMEAHVD
jgi:DNA (cytosine-5)-methyltransferase 1